MIVLTWILLAAFFAVPAGLILFLIGAKRQDPYEPAASETPDIVEQAFIENGDTLGFERSRPWTGEDTQALIATADGPAIVAGDDLKLSQLVGSIHAAYERYRRGLPIGGRRELSPLSTWTADGWVSDRRVP